MQTGWNSPLDTTVPGVRVGGNHVALSHEICHFYGKDYPFGLSPNKCRTPHPLEHLAWQQFICCDRYILKDYEMVFYIFFWWSAQMKNPLWAGLEPRLGKTTTRVLPASDLMEPKRQKDLKKFLLHFPQILGNKRMIGQERVEVVLFQHWANSDHSTNEDISMCESDLA